MQPRSYTVEYRANAVELANEIGTKKAAQQLKIPADTLYTWVARAKRGELPQSKVPPNPKESLTLAEQVKALRQENKMLRGENAQIKRENEILEEATVFFAKRRKK